MKSSFLVPVTAMLLAAACSAPLWARDDASPAGAPLGAGNHTQYLTHGGIKRQYLVHVPTRYDPASPTPLVLALHGGGGHAAYMADDEKYGLGKKADQAGFIVVFPNGDSQLPGGRFATWNAGACCGDARDRQIDDVGFLRAVVAAGKAQANAVPARVFAAGMSNGGMMSHRLACEAPDLFRAVAAVAGTDATTACQPARPVSVLHIHARDDTQVLFNGGVGTGAFRDPAKVMDFVAAPETISRWVKRNQCQPTPQRSAERPGAYCDSYAACAGGVTVRLCVTEDGGHSWPGAGSVRRGKAAASTALDANDVIWDFFSTSAAR
ncbi:MAG: prolyl oligopeptidase family serine peptidase [Microbacteriaceae bacterium]|nr:prolyl oligopeptidase family serine peptidase [Burkholderiaceae bacterium]